MDTQSLPTIMLADEPHDTYSGLVTMHPELRALEWYRLAKDYSMAQLSAAMKKQHAYIPPRTLQYLLKRASEDTHPRDRTMLKIRRFMAWARRHDREGMSRARAIGREQIEHEAAAQG